MYNYNCSTTEEVRLLKEINTILLLFYVSSTAPAIHVDTAVSLLRLFYCDRQPIILFSDFVSHV